MAERRKVPRYVYKTKGRVHPSGGGVGANVVIGVISTQGCSIQGAEGSDVGGKCELYIDWQGTELGLVAQVVAREADGSLGLQFLDVDRDTQRRLSELCNALRIQPPTGQAPEIDHGPLPAAHAMATKPAAPPPAPLPQAVRERRRVPRYVSELRAHLTNAATGATSNVRLVTLSILGGCLEGRETPETGAHCDLNTEWNGKPLRVAADIIWKNPQGRVGFKMTTPDPAAERLLREICSNLRLQPLASVPPPE
ncbi:MAG: PilZ domain-containing protein [Terriglobales bacterium]